jgi:hypothetical protein
MPCCRFVLLCLVSLLLLAAPARAGDSAIAERLFEEGLGLMEAGDAAAACEKFAASMKVEPSGGAALNHGRCSEQQGKTATAWADYIEAERLFAAAGDRERESFARGRAEALEPELSKLTIMAPATPGLKVRRNGAAVSEPSLGTAVAVDPGEIRVEATAEGYLPWSTTVTVAAGDSKVIEVPALDDSVADSVAPPAPDATEQPDASPGADPLIVSGGVVIGVGAVALVVGGVLGGTVLADADRAETDATLCPAKTCTTEGRAVITGAEDKALAANLLLGLGAAVTVTGVVLLAIGVTNDDDEASALLVPSFSPDGAGLSWTASF